MSKSTADQTEGGTTRGHSRVPEAFVAWLWENRQTTGPLATDDGRRLHVVYPGRRVGSWGPDFRGAVITLDDHLIHGDVEVHVHARDWHAHGHASDPAYLGTVLHVVFECGRAAPVVRSDGEVVPTVALGPSLTYPLDVVLARWQAAAPTTFDTGPCLAPHEAAAVLDRAGTARFEAKAARFEADLTFVAAPQALWAGLLEALGYTQNTTAFRHLADRVPWGEALHLARSGRPAELEAILLGEAGLLPSQRGHHPLDDWAVSAEDLWHATGRSGPARPLGWKWIGCRPVNGPVRRVVAAAALLDDPIPSLQERVLIALSALPSMRAATALRALLQRPASGYWASHVDWGRLLAQPAALIGPDRATEAVVNVVLPWALAVGRTAGDARLCEAARAAYEEHPPLTANEITRHMARQIAGAAAKGVVTTARRHQGLIHIYRGWCDVRDCAACPAGPSGRRSLPSRLTSIA